MRKSICVTLILTCKENFIINLFEILFAVQKRSYIIKEIEKLVLCVYGVIMLLGNVRRILEKRVKHEAHASFVFS